MALILTVFGCIALMVLLTMILLRSYSVVVQMLCAAGIALAAGVMISVLVARLLATAASLGALCAVVLF
jgi:hypothetical protein